MVLVTGTIQSFREEARKQGQVSAFTNSEASGAPGLQYASVSVSIRP